MHKHIYIQTKQKKKKEKLKFNQTIIFRHHALESLVQFSNVVAEIIFLS